MDEGDGETALHASRWRGVGRENYEVTSGGACTSFRFRSCYTAPPAFTPPMSSSSLHRVPTIPAAPFYNPFFILLLHDSFSRSLSHLFVSLVSSTASPCICPFSTDFFPETHWLPLSPFTSSTLTNPTLTRWPCIYTRCNRGCRTLSASKLRTMA